MLEIFAQTEAAIARAVEFLGTHNASPAELAAIERVQAAQQRGSSEDVLTALVEAGALQRCPIGFWREVERAAVLVLPLHSQGISPVERSRRVEFYTLLRSAGE